MAQPLPAGLSIMGSKCNHGKRVGDETTLEIEKYAAPGF
jgi:hypothetical protein